MDVSDEESGCSYPEYLVYYLCWEKMQGDWQISIREYNEYHHGNHGSPSKEQTDSYRLSSASRKIKLKAFEHKDRFLTIIEAKVLAFLKTVG